MWGMMGRRPSVNLATDLLALRPHIDTMSARVSLHGLPSESFSSTVA